MARDTTCSICGGKFDRHLAELMFDQKYAPNKYYSDLEDNFCMRCIVSMINRGVIDVSGEFYSEREPDISYKIGRY